MEISIIALPLIASIISGFFGKLIGDRNSEIITSLLVTISAILSAIVLYEGIFKESPLKNKWIENYSTDKTFLKESQLLFKSYNYKSFTLKEFYENEYQYVINDKNFNDKYQYLNINVLLPLNESFIFMQTLSSVSYTHLTLPTKA